MRSLFTFHAPFEHVGEDGGPKIIPPPISLDTPSVTVKMPSRLSAPVLTVDAAKMRKVDTANTQSLHGMWLGE